MHDKAKEKARISLIKYTDKRAKYCQEYDKLIRRLDATSDEKLQKDLEVKREVVQTCINKAESSMAKYEDHLEYLRRQEPGAPQDGGDPSDSSEGHSDAVVVETQEGGGLMEKGSTSNPRSQEAEKPMDVDQDSPSLATSDDKAVVTREEDQLLMGEQPPTGDTVSVVGDLANLSIASPASNNPEGNETL